jgi:hypothetical protein
MGRMLITQHQEPKRVDPRLSAWFRDLVLTVGDGLLEELMAEAKAQRNGED